MKQKWWGKALITIVVILIMVPTLYKAYEAYDRSLISPMPNWKIPAFTPDPENTPKIEWLKRFGK